MSTRLRASRSVRLTLRARLTWVLHLFKACVKQHHRELTPYLRGFIPNDGVVLDVGGHAGQFAKLFARLARDGHVYTVEPGSYALSILRPAVRLNRLSNVTILPIGLGDVPGYETLSVPIKQSGSIGFGLGHIACDGALHDGDPSLRHTISLTTIDELVEKIGLARLDFIKADIEGFELRMARGARRTLSRFRPALMLEVNARKLARAGGSLEALYTFFGLREYGAYRLDPERHAFVLVDPTFSGDVFFFPRERSRP